MNCINCEGYTNNPKFCSRSCSVTYHNRLKPKRSYVNSCGVPDCTNKIPYNYKTCESHRKFSLKVYKLIHEWLSGDNHVTLSISRDGKVVDTKSFVKQYLLTIRGDKCEDCGFDKHGPYGSIIQMDHINGDCFDNRPENLKLLCPNCHAMTPTYGSRNKNSGRFTRRTRGS